MHAHNQTLLARLGFADKDKGDPRHDWASHYLAQDDVLRKITTAIGKSHEFGRDDGVFMKAVRVQMKKISHETAVSKGQGQYKTTIGFLDLCCEFETTFAGDYSLELKTLDEVRQIGGVAVWGDRPSPQIVFGEEKPAWLCIVAEQIRKKLECCGRKLRTLLRRDRFDDWYEYAKSQTLEAIRIRLVIEVKSTFAPTGDILRQINLYREHLYEGACSKLIFAVVTAYPLAQEDVDVLNQSGVLHFKLGADFDAYCERRRQQQQESVPSNSPEV